jgi:predicted nucleotidyltransferase
MNSRNDLIVKWVVSKIEAEYKDDVSLLLTYGSYVNGTTNPLSDVDFYFIPKTERAYELCRTFIVEGIGFDLFPMSWERVEGLAEFKECIVSCLANVRVLFLNSEEDKKRFELLQYRLRNNLNNKGFMLERADDRLKTAMDIYRDMLFQNNLCSLKTSAGNIAMFLSDSVAYANQKYFSRGLKKQIEDLNNMRKIPQDFVLLYESITKAETIQALRDICYQIIKNTKHFLDNMGDKSTAKIIVNYKELAEFYEEGISTWNKIKVCCENGDSILAYISGTCLQRELDIITEKNGLKKIDLMSFYNVNQLEQFDKKAVEIQDNLVKLIKENGVSINEYSSIEDFLANN